MRGDPQRSAVSGMQGEKRADPLIGNKGRGSGVNQDCPPAYTGHL